MSRTSTSSHARRELARIPRSSGLNLHKRRRGKGKMERGEEGGGDGERAIGRRRWREGKRKQEMESHNEYSHSRGYYIRLV